MYVMLFKNITYKSLLFKFSNFLNLLEFCLQFVRIPNSRHFSNPALTHQIDALTLIYNLV